MLRVLLRYAEQEEITFSFDLADFTIFRKSKLQRGSRKGQVHIKKLPDLKKTLPEIHSKINQLFARDPRTKTDWFRIKKNLEIMNGTVPSGPDQDRQNFEIR